MAPFAVPSIGEKRKIVVCRDMGEEAMCLLRQSCHEVSSLFWLKQACATPHTDRYTRQLVVWENSTPPPRSWVLENVKGASGICVMMADKVNNELLDAGKHTSSISLVRSPLNRERC